MRAIGTRTRGILSVIVGVAALALAGCGDSSSDGKAASSGDSASKEKVTFAVAVSAPDPGQVFLYAPSQAGYFDKEGLDVEPVFNNGGQAALQQVATGKAEFGLTSPENLMNGVGQGLPLVAFALVLTHTIYHDAVGVPADSPLHSYSELRGKTVGVSAFTSGSYPFAQGAVASAGLDPKKDVKFAIIGNGGPAADALKNHKVDGAVTTETQWATINGLGVKVRYLEPKPSISNFPADVLVTRPDYLEKNRDQAIRFARALMKGTIAAIDDPDQAVEWYAKQFPEAAGAADRSQNLAVMKARLADMEIRPDQNGKWGYMPVPEYQKVFDFGKRFEIIKEDVDVPSLFTNDLVDEINSFDEKTIRSGATDG